MKKHPSVEKIPKLNFKQAIILAIRHKGKDSQYQAFAEELCEAVVACNHRRRGKATREQFVEELADAQMMINEFKLLEKVTDKEFKEMYEKKLQKFYTDVFEQVCIGAGELRIKEDLESANNPKAWEYI